MDGSVKIDDIEKHFETRLTCTGSVGDRLATVGIESHLLADVARTRERPDVALQAMMATVRAVAYEIQSGESDERLLSTLLTTAGDDVADAASALVERYRGAADAAGGLRDCVDGAGLFVAYPVVCSQLMDALVLRFVFGNDAAAPKTLATLVKAEPGCAHPISDRYSVTIVWTAIVLFTTGYGDEARRLLRECAIWLIDRYWDGGSGLAACDASEEEEVRQLLGLAFSGVQVSGPPGSLLACALMDLASYLGDEELYSGLRADILAAEITPRYYQVRDTPGQFEYGAADLVRIPNVQFRERPTPFASFEHGNHLRGDVAPRLAAQLGSKTFVATSLLLRDRYFPKLWPSFGGTIISEAS